MFYEPGVVITQVFTTTLYTNPTQPRSRTTVTYFGEMFAVRETVRNTIVYQNPNDKSIAHNESPYARYRYIIEDYANDRVVGVNTDSRGQVRECALIERAVLERPGIIWRVPFDVSIRSFIHKHRRENLYRIGSDDLDYMSNPRNFVVFEGQRLRPLYGQYAHEHVRLINDDPSGQWAFQFAYDVASPDFLSSPACQKDESVQLGYPKALRSFFNGRLPGEVRIARLSKVSGADQLHFAIVAEGKVQSLLDAVKGAVESGWKGEVDNISPNVRIYDYPAASLRFSKGRKLSVATVDLLQIDASRVLIRGSATEVLPS